MAKNSKPVSKAPRLDHDAIWRKMLGDLQETLTIGNRKALQAAQAAEASVSALLDPNARNKAGAALDALKIQIQQLELEGQNAQHQLETSLKAALSSIEQNRNAALASARNDEAKAEINERFQRQAIENEQLFQTRVEELFTKFSTRSVDLHEQTAAFIKDLQKSTANQQEIYSQKLDGLIADLDELSEAQTKEFEATQAARSPKEKKKTREQEVKEELRRLSGSLLTRKILRPMVDGWKSAINDKVDALKEKTGIAAVGRFLKAEKERKTRIEALLFEQQQLLTVGKLKDKLLQEKQLLKGAQENTESTRSAVKTLGQITASLRETVQMRPAMSSSLSEYDAATNIPSIPGRNANSKATSYTNIQERALITREVRALEEIAKNAGKKKKESSLLSTLLALVAPLAAAALSLLKGIKWPEFKIPDWLKPKLPAVPEALKNAVKAITKPGVVAKAVGGVSNAASKVGRAVSNIGQGVAGRLGSLGSRVSESVSSGLGRVADVARSGANLAKGVARSVGRKTADFGSKVSSAASSVVGKVGNGMSQLAKAGRAIANTPAGKFIGRNLNRLGKLATVLSVATGVYEEAQGKKVEDPKTLGSILSAILNPMEGGRWLGSKFNSDFESKMGQPFGAWIHENLGPDDGLASMNAPANVQGKSKAATATPNKTSVAAPQPAIPATSTQSTGNRVAAPAKQTMSISPSVSPGAIPDYLGIDPHLAAINLGALL